MTKKRQNQQDPGTAARKWGETIRRWIAQCERVTADREAENKRRENKKHSLPLGVKAWAEVFDVGKNKMREMMNGTDYHFKKLGGENGRKWTLPLNELPAEYLEKYRKSIS